MSRYRLKTKNLFKLNPYKRVQHGMAVKDLFPGEPGKCARCSKPLTGKKRRWCGVKCNTIALHEFRIVKGNTAEIRKTLFKQDKGKCCVCGETTVDWEADHILPVKDGGGACLIDNFRTICKECHKDKTFKLKP